MKTAKTTFLLCSCLLFLVPAFAQDSSFVRHYKNFRSLVDNYKTYALYLVPHQSRSLHAIAQSKVFFKEAYHFLNNKKIVKKNPDFVVVVLVDSLQVLRTEEVIKRAGVANMYNSGETEYSPNGGITRYSQDTYGRNYYYQLTFNVVVHTRKDKLYRFPLTSQTLVSNFEFGDNDQTLERVEKLLEDILAQYKNHYIDRVDW